MDNSAQNEVSKLCDSAQGAANMSAHSNAPGSRSAGVFEPLNGGTNGAYDLIRQSVMNLYRPDGAWHIL